MFECDACKTADEAQSLARQGQEMFQALRLPYPVVAAIHLHVWVGGR